MRKSIQFMGWFIVAFTCSSAQSAEISLQPIRGSGMHTIVGTEIRLNPGGQRVFLEVMIRDFAPHPLKSYQAQLNSTGYASGTAGVLGTAVQSCPSANSAGNSFCQTAFGDAGLGGSQCQDFDPGQSALFQCEWAWTNLSRTDWVACGLPILIGPVVITTPNYRWGMTLSDGELVFDDGSIYYGGSLALDVPADAVGTFTIGFMMGPGITFLSDENNDEINPLVLTPARITILSSNALCSNDTQCDDLDECTRDHCNEKSHECSHFLIDEDRCDDGDACTQDDCTPGGCMHSFYDGCSAIPTLSEWGIAVLALCLLIGAKLRFGRRYSIRIQ